MPITAPPTLPPPMAEVELKKELTKPRIDEISKLGKSKSSEKLILEPYL